MLSEVSLANKNESEQTNMNINKNKRNKILSYILGIYLVLGFTGRVVLAQSADSTIPMTMEQIALTGHRMTKQAQTMPTHVIEWHHGDISWLPQLAEMAGWPKKTWKRLGTIILRESGGCPNRTGGSIVDKNCNIVGHDGSDHASDSGLLQINGVNWDPKRSGTQIACARLKICTQEAILDPVNNLRVGYLMYQEAGWGPWDPCQWGPEYAARCKASK
jgi:hypothetical protein